MERVLLGNERGQGLVEYALLLILVAIATIGVLTVLGSNLTNVFYSISEVLLTGCETMNNAVYDYSQSAPGGVLSGTQVLGWPTNGTITQRSWFCHHAIDVANDEGTSIYAADSGYVVKAGWDNSGYGRMVLIDHGNGVQTLYAHMSSFNVSAGNSVAKGARIGSMGNTGHSTNPHLHFEVRVGGQRRDPLDYLP